MSKTGWEGTPDQALARLNRQVNSYRDNYLSERSKVRVLRAALIKTARLLDQYGALEEAKAADKALAATKEQA